MLHSLKRGESLTYGTRESLTYGIGVTHTDFEDVKQGWRGHKNVPWTQKRRKGKEVGSA